MSLPYETQASFLRFLKLALSIKNPDITLSPSLKARIARLPMELYDGNLEEMPFEYLIKDVFNEINEPMLTWKIFDQIRFSQLLTGNPVMHYLLSSPDARTCILDFMKFKHLIFPPSYCFKINETEDKIIFEFTEKNHKSPILHIKEDLAIGYLLYLLKDFIGRSFDFLKIMVPLHRKNFQTDIIKKVTSAEIVVHDGPAQAIFSKSFLDHKNDFYNAEIRQHYSTQVAALLVEHKSSALLSQKIIKLLKNKEQPATFSIDKIAEELNKSTSTLRRNLNSEKTSYKQLQNQVLDELCFTTLFSADFKIDTLAHNLGYSERSSFERAFRNKFGCSPTRFREFGKSLKLNVDKNKRIKGNELESLMSSISPLSSTCSELIKYAECESLELDKVVEIIESDPVFTALLMGLSNRVIYGRAPKNLHEAINNKLGIQKVISLSILFASKDCLSEHIQEINTKKLFSMMTTAPGLFQLLKKDSILEMEHVPVNTAYLLIFSMVGILLLLHPDHVYHTQISTLLKTSSGLNNILLTLENKFKLSLFGSSMILLSYWGLDKNLLKSLSALEKKSQIIPEQASNESLLFLTIDICLTKILGLKNNVHIEHQVKMLGIKNYEEIISLTFK